MEGGLDAGEDAAIVFAQRRNVAANAGEDVSALGTTKTARYLLF